MRDTSENATITQSELKSVLNYDMKTGLFTWIVDKPNAPAGTVAGTIRKNDGKSYIIITINNIKHRAHRLAFLYVNGVFSNDLTDHINGNGTDNRWCNLRTVDPVNNNRNMRRRVDNTTGVTGVHWSNKDKVWVASLKVGKDRGYLGSFHSFEEAVSVRKQAEIDAGFHPNHGEDRPL